MKTYVAIVRDHSGSMRSLSTAAANDYNLTIDGIKQSMAEENQLAFATIVECGVGVRAEVKVREQLTPIGVLSPLHSYQATGGATPLWDSVGTAITEIENVADKNDPQVAFLVMVITDGAENSSKFWTAKSVAAKIAQLQATDRWTFVFRVPRGQARSMVAAGIPAGNIMEWEQTESALVASTQATVSATRSYFKARSSGQTSVTSFYADLTQVSKADINTMIDITPTVKTIPVPSHAVGTAIKDFVEAQLGSYETGRAFYQLTKPEKVQERKQIVILDKVSGKYYSGTSARNLLGLPVYGDIKLYPGMTGNYELYVQSTSVNRKLVGNTTLLYI